MSKKPHAPGPVPPGNQPHAGPKHSNIPEGTPGIDAHGEVGSGQEHDPARNPGDFTGKGEHSFVQPGGKNDANHQS